MAEFQEVMAQKRRMCNSYALCNMGCPLNDIDFCNKNSGEKINADFPEVERRVMSWAEEHPEPVYPTWAEYLNSIGVTISDQPFPAPNIPVYVYQAGAKMFEPIPADIAEKLGIEPKEDAR